MLYSPAVDMSAAEPEVVVAQRKGGLFQAFVLLEGRLITGQQQYSGLKVAWALIDGLAV